MSTRDIHLGATLDEAAGSVGTESLAVDLCGPLGYCRLVTAAATVVCASLPSFGSSCRLLLAVCSPVVPLDSGPSSYVCSGAGRRLAGSDGQSELDSSSGFHLLVLSSRGSWGVRASPTPPGRSRAGALSALELLATRDFFLLPGATAFYSCRRNSGEISVLLIALIKAKYSCLSIAIQQELTFLFCFSLLQLFLTFSRASSS